jgi:hypothetical protein
MRYTVIGVLSLVFGSALLGCGDDEIDEERRDSAQPGQAA